jgi:transketolase
MSNGARAAVPTSSEPRTGEGGSRSVARLKPGLLRLARLRLLKMHYDAKVGHLGGNLSALDCMMLVHHDLMGRDDRFILSKGHSAGAYYVTLWSLGRLSEADLETFHGEGTILAGHPPPRGIPDIRFATGSLGHGLSLASGLALSARLRGVDRRVFCLTSDGEWQEGSTLEALIFAAHHRLSNLVVTVDHNRLQGFGSTASVASMDPLAERLRGFDIEIREADGHDLDDMRRALAPPAGERPVLAVMHTRKGHSVPAMEDRLESHYLPLTEAQFQDAMTGGAAGAAGRARP